MDSKFIFSGSEDTNLRIWKSKASEQIKPLLPREKERIAYANKLKRKYMHNEELRRIIKHKHVPALIQKKKKIK